MTRVLIVDDAIYARERIRKVLEEAKMEVVGEAATGHEAVEKYKALRPDVVTMDLVMPYMNGTEAAEAILGFDPEARIIMVSGLSQPSVLTEAMGIGMLGFVPKPIEGEELLSEIQDVLD